MATPYGDACFARAAVDVVVFGCGDDVIARHPRGFGREDAAFDPLHHLPLIERKINAPDHAAPLAEWDLPPGFATLPRRKEARMPKMGGRGYVQGLPPLEAVGMKDLHAAVRKALKLGAVGFDAVKHLVPCQVGKRPPRPALGVCPFGTRDRRQGRSGGGPPALSASRARSRRTCPAHGNRRARVGEGPRRRAAALHIRVA